MTMPAKPIIEPSERSNSPPIISSAAAVARMPSWAETSRKLTMPVRREQAAVAGDDAEEDEDEDRARRRRPSSGRAEQAAERASARFGALVAAAGAVGRGHGRHPPDQEPAHRRGAAPRGPAAGDGVSGCPCLRQVDHLRGILLGDEGGAGQDEPLGIRPYFAFCGQEHDRQVALQVLLLSMAKTILPSRIASSTSGDRSKVPSLTLPPVRLLERLRAPGRPPRARARTRRRSSGCAVR